MNSKYFRLSFLFIFLVSNIRCSMDHNNPGSLNRPVITFTTSTNRNLFLNSTFVIWGYSTDSSNRISNTFYSIDDGNYSNVSDYWYENGINNMAWRIDLKLTNGVHRVKIYAVNDLEVFSTTNVFQNIIVSNLAVTNIPLPNGCSDVKLLGQRAYSLSSSSLFSFDISDPSNCSLVDSLNFDKDFLNIEIDSDHLYLYGWKYIQIVDISDPDNMIVVPYTFTNEFDIRSFAIQSNYACLIEGPGLKVLDTSDPTNFIINEEITTNLFSSIAVNGRYSYLLVNDTWQWKSYFWIHDISDPTNMVLLNTIQLNDYIGTENIKIINDKLYILGGLKIYDISDPTNIQPINVFTNLGFVRDVAVHNDYAYFATTYGRYIDVFNISDFNNPIQVCSINAEYYAFSLAVLSNYVFEGDCGGIGALYIFNVMNP